MAKKDAIAWRYFAQVGSELIEVEADHANAHGKGAAFSTSAPVLHYRARAIVGDPDKGATTYEGIGASWKEAVEAAEAQMGKAVDR